MGDRRVARVEAPGAIQRQRFPDLVVETTEPDAFHFFGALRAARSELLGYSLDGNDRGAVGVARGIQSQKNRWHLIDGRFEQGRGAAGGLEIGTFEKEHPGVAATAGFGQRARTRAGVGVVIDFDRER